MRLLSDLLSNDADSDLAVDVNKAYAEEKVNHMMMKGTLVADVTLQCKSVEMITCIVTSCLF